MRLILSPGHRGDMIFGEALLDGLRPGYVIADKAYDADHFHNTIKAIGAIAAIPPLAPDYRSLSKGELLAEPGLRVARRPFRGLLRSRNAEHATVRRNVEPERNLSNSR